MLKKIIYPVLCSLFLTLGIFGIFKYGNTNMIVKDNILPVNSIDLNLNCSSSYLIEESTGKVLYSQNELEKLHPASMTKMMGLLLACEKIDSKKINVDDMVTVSLEASKMGGSQVFLEANEQISVNDLLKSICISSANDSMYALGEYVGTTINEFINMMNKKSKELGLENTNFINVTGFDDDNHYTCAKDMATIAKNLLKYKDIILPYTSMYEGYIRENTENPFWLVNTNKLVRFYEGLDGLKTGYTSKSGFCLTATAIRNDVRLISVIMNAKSSESRNEMTKSLLDYGFSKISKKTIKNKDEKITSIKIKHAKQEKVDLYLKDDAKVIIDKAIENPKIETKVQLFDNLQAPLKKDSVVAKFIVMVDSDTYTFDLIIKENILKLSFKELFLDKLKDILA